MLIHTNDTNRYYLIELFRVKDKVWKEVFEEWEQDFCNDHTLTANLVYTAPQKEVDFLVHYWRKVVDAANAGESIQDFPAITNEEFLNGSYWSFNVARRYLNGTNT